MCVCVWIWVCVYVRFEKKKKEHFFHKYNESNQKMCFFLQKKTLANNIYVHAYVIHESVMPAVGFEPTRS